MYKVVKRLNFCYGHRLLFYEGACSRIHGHNAILEIELSSNILDSLGMVYDFCKIKKIADEFVVQKLDHRLILHKEDPLLSILEKEGEEIFIFPNNPTAENIAKYIFDILKCQGLPITAIRLWESDTSWAEWRPNQ